MREITYHRHPDAPEVTQARVTRHHFAACGFLQQSVDPRLAGSGYASFIYVSDLRGNALHTRSLDAGTSVNLKDTAGRPLLTVSGILGTGDSTGDHSQAVNH
ncbi:TPA: RHS repeat protein, partial [Pseudomonas putida]